MEGFFPTELGMHYPVSSLPRPIREAAALTTPRLWEMAWKRAWLTFITTRGAGLAQYGGELGSTGSSGRISARSFFDRNSQAVFARESVARVRLQQSLERITIICTLGILPPSNYVLYLIDLEAGQSYGPAQPSCTRPQGV